MIITDELVTFRPAKNGAGTCFGADHTFFGEVVNFAETLHDICQGNNNKLKYFQSINHSIKQTEISKWIKTVRNVAES